MMTRTIIAAVLSPIRERQAFASDASLGFSRIDERRDALIKSCYEDVPRLLAAVDAALKLADEWEADSFIVDPEISLRVVIAAALTGEDADAPPETP